MLFLYLIKRDKIIEQKFRAFELSLEEIHKELFELKKKLNNKN